MPTETCAGCGLTLPAVSGATDPYGGASASCWAAFGEVTAKDFGEYRYPDVHRLIVDAYMAQHPGFETAAGRRSVLVHLVGLYLALEKGLASKDVGAAMGRVFADKRDPAPLVPVPFLGALTVASVRDAPDRDAHERAARAWAASVWRAWSPHRATVVALGEAAVGTRR